MKSGVFICGESARPGANAGGKTAGAAVRDRRAARIMEIGCCPRCNSRDVRLGRTWPAHLAHLAKGSRRRYCRACRHRWLTAERIYSPSARYACIALAIAPWAALTIWVTVEIWNAPPIRPRQAVGWEQGMHGTLQGQGAAGGMTSPLSEEFAGRHVGMETLLRGAYSSQAGMPQQMQAGRSVAQEQNYRRLAQRAGVQSGMNTTLMQTLAALIGTGKTPGQLAKEIEGTDKQTLWKTYGSNFSSKEEARAAYDKFMSQRNEFR